MLTGAELSCTNAGLAGQGTDIYDSGTSRHMSPDQHQFVQFTEIQPQPVKAADKATFSATRIGSLQITILNRDMHTQVMLKDVLYCPDLAFTLVSLARCDIAGYTVTLKDQKCSIQDPRGMVIGQVSLVNGLYQLDH
jgi:Pol polyprotein, beta-barrel domain